MSDLPFDVEPVVQPRHPHIDPASMPINKIDTSVLDAVLAEPVKKGKGKKEVVPPQEPVNEFAAFYVAEISHPGKMLFGLGIHGYVSTQLVAKRGYGLKKWVPTPKGYRNDGKQELKVISQVIDMRVPLHAKEDTLTVANILIRGCELALNYAASLEDVPKSICLMVPRKNLASFLTKGYTKAIEAGYKDAKGNDLPFREALDGYVRTVAALDRAGIKVSVEYMSPDTHMGLPESMALARDAVLAAQKANPHPAEPNCLVSVPEGYWNHDHGRHPLLGKSRMVFKMADGKVVDNDHLYLMDFEKTSKKKEHLHKLEIEVGQLLPSASYCVARLNEVDPIIRQVQEQHTNYLDTRVERLGVLFLDAVFKPGAHSVMSKVGAGYLHSETFVTDLVDSYGAMYTHELNPARQAHRAWNTYLDMQSLVTGFLRAMPKGEGATIQDDGGNFEFHNHPGSWVATNITSRFMERKEDAKGKSIYKASKEVETPAVSLLVDCAYMDTEAGDQKRKAQINLSIGIDMPKRNAIAAMANENFKAFILVRQDTAFTVRHYVVVTNGDEYGIWAAPFANRTFVKK
jgi:hypothetical protein